VYYADVSDYRYFLLPGMILLFGMSIPFLGFASKIDMAKTWLR
jgi:hypothetical protein